MVSVIVPVYNAKEYLKDCIDSIINQTYSNLEIIIIDDGSTDGSGKICDDYSKMDNRIRVIHQTNRGLVYSRKVGVNTSKGEWIAFIDSDDWIAHNMIESLVNYAISNDADVVISGYFMAVGESYIPKYNNANEGVYEGEKLEKLKLNLFDTEDYFSFSILPYIWNKMWKRSLIEKNLYSMDDAIKVGEDVAIGFPAILQALRVYVTKDTFYYYRQNNMSMIRAQKDEYKELNNTKFLINSIKDSYKRFGYYDLCREGIERLFINQLFTRSYSIVDTLMKNSEIYPFEKTNLKSVIVYGAGALGTAIYEYLSENGKVKNWVDINADSIRLLGYPVKKLDEIEIDKDDMIFVCIFSRRLSNLIREDLLKKGINEKQIKIFKLTHEEQVELLSRAYDYQIG